MRAIGAILLLVALGAPSAALAAPRYDTGLLRITAPRDERIASAGRVRLSFTAAPGARTIRVYRDRRRVRSLVARGRRYSATVSLRGLRPGPHRLLVTARAKGRRDADAVTVFVGRRRRSLLSVRTVRTARARAVYVPLHLRLARTPRRLKVQLNGRDAHRGLWPLFGRVRSGRVTAAQGLRFGRNRLVVRALLDNGTYDVERRIVHVPRRVPLASAGSNRQGKVGRRIRLDGRPSLATRHGRDLSYSWRLVRAPRGSKARLRRADSARPLLRPDRAGRFHVRLTVREGRRGRASASATGASDTMILQAGPTLPPIGWAIDTLASQNGQAGISYGPNFAANTGPSGSLQILVLDRGDLTTTETPSTNYFDLSSSAGVDQLTSALNDLSEQYLVVLAGGASMTATTLPQVNQALDSIGVNALPAGTTGPFSAIGVHGAPSETMFVNPWGPLYGYIQSSFTPSQPPSPPNALPPPTNGYTFAYGAYEPFQLSTSGSTATIALGPLNLSLTSTGHSGGAFAAVVVSAQDLQPVGPPQDPSNLVYYVNDPAIGVSEQRRLAQVLTAYQDRPDTMLALQTIGAVGGPVASGAGNPEWSALAAALGKFGATQHLFNTIDGAYSLVGGPGFDGPAAETSTLQSKLPAAQLQGVLGANNEYSIFEPLLHDPLQPGAGYDYSLLTTAYQQPPQAWPGESDPNYETTYEWISQQPGVNPDLRSAYVHNESLDWGEQLTNLRAAYPNCPTNDADVPLALCQSLITSLEQEVQWVPVVYSFFSNIEEPFSLVSGAAYAQLNAAYGDVAQSVPVSPGSDAFADILDVLSEGFDLAAYASVEEFEPVLGSVGAIVGAAAPLVTTSEGQSVLEELQFDVTQLGMQLEDAYLNSYLAYGQIAAIIVSDYGKLEAVGTAISSNDPGYLWSGASPDSNSDAINTLLASTERWAWGRLMPVAWPAWLIPNTAPWGETVSPLVPGNWPCDDGGTNYAYPFTGTPSDGTGWFLAYISNGSVVAPQMWLLGQDHSSWGFTGQGPDYHFPPQQLTDDMNDSFYGNLMLQAQFWTREFEPRPLNGSFINGCAG